MGNKYYRRVWYNSSYLDDLIKETSELLVIYEVEETYFRVLEYPHSDKNWSRYKEEIDREGKFCKLIEITKEEFEKEVIRLKLEKEEIDL